MNRPKGGQRASPAFSESHEQTEYVENIPKAYISACETIKAVTGGTEEEIFHVLKSCNYDVEETTNKLLDSPFETFQSKGKKKKNTSDAKKAMPKPMPMYDGPSGPRRDGRGPRSRDDYGRDSRGPPRGYGGGGRGGTYSSQARDEGFHPRSHPTSHSDELIWDSQPLSSASQGEPMSSGEQRPLYSRMSGDNGSGPSIMSAPLAPAPAPIRPLGVAQPGQRSVADVLKGHAAPSLASSISGPSGFSSNPNSLPPPPSASTTVETLQSQDMRTSAPLSTSPNFSALLAPQPSSHHKETGGWNSKSVNNSGRYGTGSSPAEGSGGVDSG
eukprot:CAMPEP_0196581060 /NCGR_PEP_ID=MMETSP1081-20130531/32196_1 /TAXON_ID=36882 /ORGANISM="Pyramimonas amylifera, Strain CCMP720" /LENGTH=327 /DNA_ID=CAMNT_0041901151 /DNA_START=144 /DNA_END=1123 /DNA_ORIENTATION=+